VSPLPLPPFFISGGFVKFLKRKLMVLVVCLVLGTAVTSQAFLFAIPAVTWVAGALGAAELANSLSVAVYVHGAIAAGLIYFNREKVGDKINSWVRPDSVVVKGEMLVTDIDLSTVPPIPVIKKAPVEATIANQALKDIVLKDEASKQKYPILAAALLATSPVPGPSKDTAVGQVVFVPDIGYSIVVGITGAGHYNGPLSPQCSAYSPGNVSCLDWRNTWSSSSGGTDYNHLIMQPAEAPPPHPIVASDVPNVLTVGGNLSDHSTSDNKTRSEFSGDIDSLIHDNPNVLHYETGGSSGASGNSVPDQNLQGKTREALDSAARTYNTYNTLQNNASTAAAGADALKAASDAAAARAAAASAAAASAGGADAVLNAAAAAAQGAADAALAASIAAGNAAGSAAAAANGANGTANGDGTGEKDSAASVPESDARKEIDTTPLDALKGALATTYPFNLPSVIGSYYDKFAVDAIIPVFSLHLPLGQVIEVDLAPFEPVAKLCRFLVGLLVTSGMLFYIVHFFRGIS
jgi:hypothetical protein